MIISIIFMLTIPLLIVSSFFFMQLSHPLAMGLMLFIQTVLISITIGVSNFSFWFSYILFLVFLGGMLVLFIYIASLASNESFSFSLITFFFAIILTGLIIFILLFLDPILISPNSSSLSTSSLKYLVSTPFIVNWVYNTPSMMFTIFIVSYLLLMLIVVVKIINLFKGPLRLML
uniref:NADH-ubiquinone oxidoreductase chain 6 n=1 Tax=Eriocheir sinensis TaxID=95602 RepID=Q53E81_ERISI|nr:NADH dehydrogenase subunit 6 [Eriocheir sinensis]AAP22054.1 NADH dehydrogenase subunit 6 [Eriocheir sinensis]ACJ44972.1 NADH dehydrogenase subunit 6 [Eriocheir sinensis]AJD76854.1 NADH dehydrogenase subunit 6 [Eriocheir sinensis]AJF48570.1 NADH dehydrogenase subunit 6 [Eriocheir sinensis]AKA67047.1 NADH dehydrogenase subunit 6 [Eriocheir sinensis]